MQAFHRSPAWTTLVERCQPGAVVEFGVGSGEKLCAFLRSVQPIAPTAVAIAIDLNERFLSQTEQTVRRAFSASATPPELVLVRSEFDRVPSLISPPIWPMQRPERVPHLFLMLGGTVSNFEDLTDPIMCVLSHVRPGDLLVISSELLAFADEPPQDPNVMYQRYWTKEFLEFFYLPVRLLFPQERASPSIDMLPEGDAVTYSARRVFALSRGHRAQTFYLARYREPDLVEAFARHGFVHRLSVGSPANRYYRYLAFEFQGS